MAANAKDSVLLIIQLLHPVVVVVFCLFVCLFVFFCCFFFFLSFPRNLSCQFQILDTSLHHVLSLSLSLSHVRIR